MTPQKSQPKVVMANRKGEPKLAPANGKTQPVDWAAFLAGVSRGKTVLEYGANRTIFVQGDPADSVWYLHHGKVKLAVTSRQGKEAIVSVLGDNEFFGEGCLAGQPLRISAATTVSDCTLYRIEKALMVRLLHEQHGISELFVTHLLTRNTRFEEDLVEPAFQLQREAPGPHSLIASAFRQGKQNGNCPSRNQPGTPRPNGRHHPVAGQPFHE